MEEGGKQAAQGSAATAQKPSFAQMSRSQRVVHVLKIIASIVSFGFLFPND
jgi:hypothetical protein